MFPVMQERPDLEPPAAPMMTASDHFIREDEDLRPENAVLGNLCACQNAD